jgi:hypothetical protein
MITNSQTGFKLNSYIFDQICKQLNRQINNLTRTQVWYQVMDRVWVQVDRRKRQLVEKQIREGIE